MKKGLTVLVCLLFVASAFSFHFYSIRDALKQDIKDFVALKGRLVKVNPDERYIIIKDDTGRVRIKIDNLILKHVQDERWENVIKVWGHIYEDARGKYVMARKVRIRGQFFYNNNYLH